MCTAAVFVESVSLSPGNCVQSDVVGNCTSFGSLEDVSPLIQALDGDKHLGGGPERPLPSHHVSC